jgi:mannose-1-phosphate guanylyltransferase
MRDTVDLWAVVLAGGDGRRLRSLTTTREGLMIPKQYCSLQRSSCLLQDALQRAQTVAMRSHLCSVVAAEHRKWWTPVVSGLNESNVFIQPNNKGTAYGILLALLNLEAINPDATATLLPADHHFRDEGGITRILRVAANLARSNPGATYLLGAEPDTADSELGYILPAQRVRDRATNILGFTEKPAADYARELVSLGALWSLFMLVGTVRALLDLFTEHFAQNVAHMREAIRLQSRTGSRALEEFYATLEPVDFSRDVLEVQATRLQVIRVPPCGWTDLGTPQRVAATLRELNAGVARPARLANRALFFDLGEPRACQ